MADLGADSLDQLELIMTAEEVFSVRIGLNKAAEIDTLADLVEAIQDLRGLRPVASARPRNIIHLRALGWWQMAAAAAALVVASLLGFHLGQTSSVAGGAAGGLPVAASEGAMDDDALFLDPAVMIAAGDAADAHGDLGGGML